MRMTRLVTQLSSVVVFVCAAIGLSAGQEAARGRASTPRGQISQIPAEAELAWPLPPSAKAYESIDGNRMKRYVEELAAIAGDGDLPRPGEWLGIERVLFHLDLQTSAFELVAHPQLCLVH